MLTKLLTQIKAYRLSPLPRSRSPSPVSDRMIEADVLAQEQSELGKLDQLENEIEKELARDRQKS